jgi:hypothetical protein
MSPMEEKASAIAKGDVCTKRSPKLRRNGRGYINAWSFVNTL